MNVRGPSYDVRLEIRELRVVCSDDRKRPLMEKLRSLLQANVLKPFSLLTYLFIIHVKLTPRKTDILITYMFKMICCRPHRELTLWATTPWKSLLKRTSKSMSTS